MGTIYFAGGCLWGVQAFIKTLPGVIETEAGRANGQTNTLDGPYDGYAECVKTTFDHNQVTVVQLMGTSLKSLTHIASTNKVMMSVKNIAQVFTVK